MKVDGIGGLPPGNSMYLRILIVVLILIVAILAHGCGGTAEDNNTANTANTGNTNTTTVGTKPTPIVKQNEAPTLSPVYQAYCAAMVKKDEAALRRIYSSDTIEYFEEQMKIDGKTSLIDYIYEDKVSPEMCEVFDETITGDEAVGFIRSASYPNGLDVVFVRENGEWKLTNRSPKVNIPTK